MTLIVGLISGIISGLIVSIVYLEPIYGLIYGLVFGAILGLISGLIIAIIYAFISGGVVKIESKTISKLVPNQGIWASFKNMITIVILFSLPFILGILWFLFFHNIKLTIILILLQLFIILIAFSPSGGLACIQHFSLRLVLWHNGYIPWNYAKFLDRAAERRIIQKVGGSYRFIHRLLLDHFADMPISTSSLK